jgi:hypothetical protein
MSQPLPQLQAALERAREARATVARELPGLEAAVRRSAEAARRAKIDAEITPGSQAKALIERAQAELERAVQARDAAADRAALLDDVEKDIVARIAECKVENDSARREAAIAALYERLETGREAALKWAADAVVAQRLRGVVVSDVGLAVVQALFPNKSGAEPGHALSSVAFGRLQAIERGEEV